MTRGLGTTPGAEMQNTRLVGVGIEQPAVAFKPEAELPPCPPIF